MKSDKLDEIEIPVGLEGKLSDLIDRLAEKEKRMKRKMHISWICGIAASVLILFSIGFFYSTRNTLEPSIASNHIVIEDPEIASREIQKALLKVSENFNKGMEQLNLLSDNEILDKIIR